MDPQDKLITLQEFEPTTTQVERAARLKRFNVLYVYTPIAAGGLIIVVATFGLLYLSLAEPSLESRRTISAVADAFLTLATIPALLLCAVVPTIWLIAAIQLKQRDASPVRGTRILFWRVFYVIAMISDSVSDVAAKIARPFIQANARAAYLNTLRRRLYTLFIKRS